MGKVVVLGQSGLLFWQKLINSDKSSYLWAKVVVFGQSGCIGENWLYSGKKVVFGQT